MAYIDYITSENRQTNFLSIVEQISQPFVDLQNMIIDLNVNTATGFLLDIIGEWVGVSRNISTPLIGVYFEWDGTAAVGWDSGVWKDLYDPDSGLTRLPDDSYRILIKTKIAANHWDGTASKAYDIWANLFPNSYIIITDNLDMSMNIGIAGEKLDAVTLALLTGGYIPLKPMGVRINYYQISVDSSPLFAWDITNQALNGWGSGSWAQEITA